MKKFVFWIAVVLMSLSVFYFLRPNVETNIFELISDPRFELVNRSVKGNIVRVYFRGREKSLDAALFFKSEISLKVLEVPDVEQMLKSLSVANMLSVKQQAMLQEENAVTLVNQGIQQKLTSPLSSYYSYFLESDPLLLLPESILQWKDRGGFESVNGILVKDGGAFLLLDTPLNMSRANQKEAVQVIEETIARTSRAFPEVEIRWSGLLRFADSSASRMEGELQILSVLNILIIVSLLFYAFRSFRPMLLCVLAISCGMLGGAATVVLWKKSIHILTLGFGGSLLGACVDYPLHYFCASQEANKSHVLRAIFLGALTTAMAFFSLMFSGFEGLVEISLFSIGSVFLTWLTVNCVHAQVHVDFPQQAQISSLCQNLSRLILKFRTVFLLGLALIFAIGAARFKVDDDVRLLQSTPQELIEAEKWIQQKSGQGIPSGMIFVRGESPELLDNRISEVSLALEQLRDSGALEGFESKFSTFPSLAQQQESYRVYTAFVQQKGDELRASLREIGLEQILIEKVFQVQQPKQIAPNSFDTGEVNGFYWSFIPLYGVTDVESLHTLIGEKGFYYDSARELTHIFSGYRNRSVILVGLSYVFIFLLFIFRYGLAKGTRYFLPAVISAIASIFLLTALGFPISFFSILALIIVLGLTIDYSIFYLEGQYRQIPPSILISAVTTILSFGILGISSTPVLAHFGIVVSFGILFSLILSHPRT